MDLNKLLMDLQVFGCRASFACDRRFVDMCKCIDEVILGFM